MLHTTHQRLSELWSHHETPMLRQPVIDAVPIFYPIYSLGDVYSYSPLPLIEMKGHIRINHSFLATHKASLDRRLQYHPDESTIDADIRRVGRYVAESPAIFSPEEFVAQVARSLVEDLTQAELDHPAYKHIVLCGGKDSLTLLLHKWRTRPLAVSAYPNFPLVKRFISDNRIDCDLLELADNDGPPPPSEVEANCCLNDLQHCRWTADLTRLANELDHKVVFWKGQLGDVFLTPKWRNYTNYRRGNATVTKATSEAVAQGRSASDIARLSLHTIRHALWDRGALWQGAHMSLLRRATGALFLSGYHGPSMEVTVSRANLPTTSVRDLRDDIGRTVSGGAVRYPDVNPGPEPYSSRVGWWRPEEFLRVMSTRGITIVE